MIALLFSCGGSKIFTVSIPQTHVRVFSANSLRHAGRFLVISQQPPIQQLHFLNGRLWLVQIVNEDVYSLVEIDFIATLTGHFTSDTLLVSGWTRFGSQNLFNSL